jgi:outer membrane cobalamin receptor
LVSKISLMKKTATLLLLFALYLGTWGQMVKIYGKVTDDKSQPMIGATVAVKGTSTGALTDTVGNYDFEVDAGTHTLVFSYVGYTARTVLVTVLDVKEKRVDIELTDSTKELDIVVVTGTKYSKKLSEEMVSMEVVKAQRIEDNSEKMDEAMNKVPGVNMMGRTISIRGGSGFSDATSNRVLALLDEVPIIDPANGGIIWDMVPIEELEQVEIIKGATSSLYGSSALDGVLNMVTVNPQPQMENKVILSYGLYDQPNNRSWDYWWHRNIVKKNGKLVDKLVLPMFGGGQLMHRRQYGDVGVVLSGAYQQNQNYLQNADYFLVRMGAKLRYTPHKHPHLTLGLNTNFFHKNYKDFFAAAGLDSNTYIAGATPSNPTPAIVRQRAINISPYMNFYDDKDNRHSLKFQMFNVMYNSTTGDSTNSVETYVDYTFMHNFRKADLILTMGADGFYSLVRGKTFAGLVPNILSVTYYNTRDIMNYAAFAQVEKKFFHKLSISAGVRIEYAQLAGAVVENRLPLINVINKAMGGKHDIYSPATPLGRIGLNYQATEGTFIRGSFGQGFRYPSLAEKYVYTLRSGAQVFPNDTLHPENGWSAEVGIKQGVKISKWMAYFDLSGFVNRYHDMIEFELDNNPPVPRLDIQGIPFMAQNVDNARIMGIEFSTIANGSIFGVPLTFLIGYTYIDPVNLSYNPNDPNSTYILKYRIQHNFKADIQSNYKGFVLGITGFYGSNIKNIDNGAIGALQMVSDFRKSHDKGEFVMDVRAGYNYKDKATFMFICKNVLNTEYMLQPGIIDPPRNYTFQVGYNF